MCSFSFIKVHPLALALALAAGWRRAAWRCRAAKWQLVALNAEL